MMLTRISVVLALVLLGGVMPAHADVQVVGVGTLAYDDSSGPSGCTQEKVVHFSTFGDTDFTMTMQAASPGSEPARLDCGAIGVLHSWYASSRTQHSASCPPIPERQGYSRDGDTYTIVQQPQCLGYSGDATATTILTVNASVIDFELTLTWPDDFSVEMKGTLTRLA